jgi:hypothetical protein
MIDDNAVSDRRKASADAACPPSGPNGGKSAGTVSHDHRAEEERVALIPFDADKTSSLTSFIEWLIAEGAGDPC